MNVCVIGTGYVGLVTGTVFAGTKVRLSKWFLCLHLMGRKMSTLELAEELKVNKDTAWRMRKLLAEALSRGRLLEKLKGMGGRGPRKSKAFWAVPRGKED